MFVRVFVIWNLIMCANKAGRSLKRTLINCRLAYPFMSSPKNVSLQIHNQVQQLLIAAGKKWPTLKCIWKSCLLKDRVIMDELVAKIKQHQVASNMRLIKKRNFNWKRRKTRKHSHLIWRTKNCVCVEVYTMHLQEHNQCV